MLSWREGNRPEPSIQISDGWSQSLPHPFFDPTAGRNSVGPRWFHRRCSDIDTVVVTAAGSPAATSSVTPTAAYVYSRVAETGALRAKVRTDDEARPVAICAAAGTLGPQGMKAPETRRGHPQLNRRAPQVASVLTQPQPNLRTISPATYSRSRNIAPIAAGWGRRAIAAQGCQTSRNSPTDRTDSAAESAENVRGAAQGMSDSSTRHMSTPIP